MTETLVVRLSPEDPTRGAWIAVDDQGRRTGLPGAGALADAAPLGAGKRLVVLVPAVDVLLTRVSLPLTLSFAGAASQTSFTAVPEQVTISMPLPWPRTS